MAPHKVDPRKSIYINDHLQRLLATGRVAGKTPSQRIDRLVARYDVLVREAFPKRLELTSPELLLLADVVGSIDLSEPDYALVAPTKIQQIGDAGSGGAADASGLAYRLKNLKLSELLAVIDQIEHFRGLYVQPTREDAKAFLDGLRPQGRL